MTKLFFPAKPCFCKRDGLVPAIAQCAETGRVLMLAYMNEEAWNKTLETGEAHYWSRSRSVLWRKGDTSGNVQQIASIRLDCDKDTVLLLVKQLGGAACHEGYASCFFRELNADGSLTTLDERLFDPKEVYK